MTTVAFQGQGGGLPAAEWTLASVLKQGGYNTRRTRRRQLASPTHRSTVCASYDKMIDMNTVTVSPKFQVVIPLELRRRLKIEPGAKLMVVEFNGGLRLMPLKPPAALRGIARGLGTTIEREPDRPL